MTSRRAPVLYRIEWEAGYGWPDCERRERTARNFTSLAGAARQLAIIRRLPSHHVLVGTYLGRVEWEDLPIEDVEEELARLEEEDCFEYDDDA